MKVLRTALKSIYLSLLALSLSVSNTVFASSSLPDVTLYLNEGCKCCLRWASHMEEAGFPVELKFQDHDELQELKNTHGVGDGSGLGSCHTAFVDGYVIEGHVPAEQVKELLQKRPDVTGLSVPGMPLGSPGMDSKDEFQEYDVLAFDANGDSTIFASYEDCLTYVRIGQIRAG